MFSSRKPVGSPSKSKPKARGPLSQYGLFDVPNVESLGNDEEVDIDDDDDDTELEAELMNLMSGGNVMTANKDRPSRPAPVPHLELGKMVEESLKDLSDTDLSSNEENDPDLLGQLHELVGHEQVPAASGDEQRSPTSGITNESDPVSKVSLLKERLEMYETAARNAKAAGDDTKLRRLNRGIKILQDLKEQADACKDISEEDIPPPVSVVPSKHRSDHSDQEMSPAKISSEETPSAIQERATQSSEQSLVPPPVPPRSRTREVSFLSMVENTEALSPQKKNRVSSAGTDVMSVLTERQEQYKKAAVDAKRNGDMETALRYVKIVKQFGVVIDSVKEGNTIDLSSVPPPPPDISVSGTTTSDMPKPPVSSPSTIQQEKYTAEPMDSQPSEEASSTIPQPRTVLEALEQRLLKYKEIEQTAKEKNDSRKSRQTGRIIASYQEAIKLCKAGKTFDVESLPTPYGYPPLPTSSEASVTQIPDSSPAQPPVRIPQPKPVPISPQSREPDINEKMKTAKASAVTRNEKQLQGLLEIQRLFKVAALKAKQKGELSQAKEYLKLSKQIQPLIEASNCGLPVDMTTIPVPPTDKIVLESDFDIVTLNNSVPGSDAEVFQKLESDLKDQLEMCMKTRDHYKAMGDIANANRFDHLAVQSKKDLSIVQLARSQNESVPKFHYETRPFSIVQCNADLTDNDVEVTIGQGVSYNVTNPKEVDTYVKVTFPYPSDAPQQYKTPVIYNTNNPTYNSVYRFSIQRNLRACQRIFKRQVLKCEVFSKGWFFRGDSIIGTATVKLQPLETQCAIHDAFDLMEGRKAVGGKLEVKIRVRNPILSKQVEQVQQKWLMLDL